MCMTVPAAEALEIPIEGMTCGGCASSVRRALERQPGVEAVEVSAADHRARLRWDPLRGSLEGLVGAIEAAGFEVPAGWQAAQVGAP
jgi:copper chaperone CopZ